MIATDDLRFFLAIAEAPSLAAASRALDVSPPAVTQRLRALEERLGTHLVDRAGRHLALTDEGEVLAERGRAILDALGELDEALAARRGQVVGHLRVVAPLGFGRRHVAPVAAAFQAAHPEVAIDLTLSDRLGGVPEGTFDLAVHVGEIAGAAPGLIARRLAPNARIVCAAPAYLAARPAPVIPDDLRGHACIALRENDEDVTLWRFVRDGREARVRIEPRLASNDGEVVRGWALAGRGVILRSEWDVADDLRAGRLVRLLPDFAAPEAPVVALLGARRRARAARTRRFLDALAAALDPAPWREPAA
ncbi:MULTISPECIES: LysR family transcriptional regulator [Methylobacterium]|jgi:DNA-binding transcriptional LysR family regulator|uniref:LysR family transcriptional regulator n=2 Tax=Methylobacteriaceae TaxID=119045 RepID=UPI0008E1A637|nr:MULTISPECIES: LysR family transcriptional regulator [Methylobacterium]MBK3397518.1 LysR family transcriptional regulator [Methylobacterium ajmalii]MBK3409239.1 LysR family transcriptional regulator [Methylobacterium ajmalii]MBZ6413711.1 LysR family transcriptional regulator [Methylobacterium sp.]SFF40821.1 DNA-binding transcriptional regulator, LysR family [Methylobacterium sp. yr596]